MTREGDRPLLRNKRWGKAAVTEPMTENFHLFSNGSVTGEKRQWWRSRRKLSPVFERLGYW
ncbi:hypothetical protein [Bacteroides pyogenes]|uniref:hypothetical protein n=1 Tax=Bacteroides pyogenes TaxID=310300 RepID=UPI0016056C03|nr:hypothetical protein [Bacteroides pyogenes]MBB3893899.1 hypothetical protein [Bacteroides pyogenes]